MREDIYYYDVDVDVEKDQEKLAQEVGGDDDGGAV